MLLYMGMIADMVFTVAVIALAAGTVTEFQLRIAYISPAADGAFVGVVGLGLGNGGLVGAGFGEGDYLWLI